LRYTRVGEICHDTEAFTEGLMFSPDGRLFESSGLVGQSMIREIDPRSGWVLRRWTRPAREFAEGIAASDGGLVQLTENHERGYRLGFDGRTLGEVRWRGPGWGLTYIPDRAEWVMSNGTSALQFFARDWPADQPARPLRVCASGQPLGMLNELEYARGSIWANVYARRGEPTPIDSNHIVRIDPATGTVTATVDLSELACIEQSGPDHELNGIAWQRSSGHFFVTGKRWRKIYVIEIHE
jgi:glutamine cyclotransferase